MGSGVERARRYTAEAARRVTGITTPLGGLQWADPGPSDQVIIRQFLIFLEDRRVLYNPMQLEVPWQVVESIKEIRMECTHTLKRLGAGVFAERPVRAIRTAGRRFHDDCSEDFRYVSHRWEQRMGDVEQFGPGFFTALGALRATVGNQVALLSAYFDIDVEGDLASVMPSIEA
ncbi:DUF6650 family protein [Salinarimonas sp. NSM]|uniref:DUF6650 family protein n=1 Tax=Salinarimonas sp. NSM TaxID=3458003 RepID=UPI00403605E4